VKRTVVLYLTMLLLLVACDKRSEPSITGLSAVVVANLPSSVGLQQWETKPAADWVNGNLGANNSDYSEGETVPFQLDVGGLSTGGNPYTFSVCRDFSNGTKRGYLFLAPFNTSRLADPSGTITSTSGPISGVSVTINSVTEVAGQGACNAGQRETIISINSGGAATAFVLWGGHLASPIDIFETQQVGAGNGAASFPGSSLHMSLLSPSKDRSINPAAIIELATITVQKVVDVGSATPDQFCFNISANPNNETLPKCPPSGGNSVTFLSLPTGSYTITETGPTDYAFATGSGTNCTFSGSTATAGITAATTPTDATCVFHNALKTGTLRVKKHVVNDNGGAKTAADFELHVKSSGSEVSGSPAAGSETGTVYTLTVGTYVVSEDAAATGYAQTGFSGDCSSTGTVTVGAGAERTCTITNDDVAAQLTVIKHVVNSFGGTATAADFTMSVTGNSPAPGSFAGHESPGTVVSLGAGSYSVAETGPSGYSSNFSTDCTGSIAVGQAKTCTITNSDIQPRVTVIKHVVNSFGGTATAGNFTMTVTGVSPSPGTFAGAESPGTAVTLGAGSYSVAETGPTGYSSSFSTDCTGSIAVGQTKTCTITNSDIRPQLIVIKHVINDNGGTAVASDFTLSVTGSSPSPASSPGAESPGTSVALNVGAYSVSETGPSGYGASFSADCTGSIAVGGTKTCMVTNDDIAPQLTVTKVVINDNGRTKTASDFPLFVDGSQVTTGVRNAFKAGPHTVSETGDPRYAGTISGDCAASGAITLNPGDVKSCTITNDDIAKALGSVGTTPNPTSGSVGATLNDQALLIGATLTAAGTITFRLYSPSATCPGTPTQTQIVPVSGNGNYSTSPGFNADAPGTWRWTAEYSGDDFNGGIVPTAADCNLETVTITAPVARLTPGYWKNHLSKAKLPQTLGNYTVDSYDKATAVYSGMNCSNVQDQNAIGCLAGHLLAATLNVANGADGCIGPTIATADAFLKSIGYSGPTGGYPTLTATQRSTAISLKTTLDQYNNNISCP